MLGGFSALTGRRAQVVCSAVCRASAPASASLPRCPPPLRYCSRLACVARRYRAVLRRSVVSAGLAPLAFRASLPLSVPPLCGRGGFSPLRSLCTPRPLRRGERSCALLKSRTVVFIAPPNHPFSPALRACPAHHPYFFLCLYGLVCRPCRAGGPLRGRRVALVGLPRQPCGRAPSLLPLRAASLFLR